MFHFPKAHKKSAKSSTETGFSLVESTIALTTLGICLAYAMPLFLYSKINNVKSEVRTGALMVSQKIFDDMRGLPFDNIKPTSVTAPLNPDGSTAASRGLTTIPQNEYNVMNRTYTANVFHCEVATDCDANYRTFRVEVIDKRNDQVVYEMEGGITNFR
jgi:type II secretory pathway pseudopilin PulG